MRDSLSPLSFSVLLPQRRLVVRPLGITRCPTEQNRCCDGEAEHTNGDVGGGGEFIDLEGVGGEAEEEGGQRGVTLENIERADVFTGA